MNDNNIQTATEAFKLYQDLINLKKTISLNFLQIGKVLHDLRQGLWKQIEPDLTWEGFCATPEISLSPSHSRNLIRIYKRFCLELQVEPEKLINIDQRKLTTLVPIVDENNVEEKLAVARALSRADFDKEIRPIKDHACRWERITYERCAECHEQRSFSKEVVRDSE